MGKRDFFNQNKKFFMDDIEGICEYVSESCMDEFNNILPVADDVVNKKFIFNLRWDMERTTVAEEFDNEINWLHIPGDDPEWIYQFNRHRFWICLGQAYVMTKNEKYAKAFVEQITHWIKNVKFDDEKNALAWRTIEAGLRLEYWLKAIRYFKNSPYLTEEVYEIFEVSVKEHAEFLMGMYDTFRLVSNWGVLQNHGLFIAGVMLPESERTIEYRNESLRRLAEEIEVQVYEDGVHWEQSPMYHNEVAHCYLDIKILCDRNNIELPEVIKRKLYKMAYGTFYHKKPDHNEIMMGDSDDIDVRDIVTKAAYLYKDGVLKFGGYDKFDFDCIWDLGVEAAREYIDIAKSKPKETAIELKESGNYYLHSDWSEDENFFHFHCGTLGAGHGHSDKLHIDLFANGEDILVDSGRYTYVDKPERYEFKDPSAHNTITVDGEDFIVCVDPWECSKLTRAINQKMVKSKDYDYVEGGHLGYYDIKGGGVYINRRIIYIKPDIYVIVDEFYSGSRHKYNQYFHFNNTGKIFKKSNNFINHITEKNYTDVCFIAKDMNFNVKETRYSKHYNQYENKETLITEHVADGFSSVITVISTNSKEKYKKIEVEKLDVKSNFKGIIFEDKLIEAINIQKDNKKYTVVVAHQDYASPTDSFNADGCIGFGQVVVFNRSNKEERIGKVLLY
ncbi:alginate lyase family protein [Clostridium sp. AL.422]|uniref:alginate lyase family protein n=1 Tax=Clostridium TaxID=1485 RepID=UPI00293DE787|nr:MULTISPECIES: alginate lyase family protein [unclassified Clostridium]MDV4149801.1 alginate lyase family protein [Clostridium sp. AL.422]